MSTFGQYSQNAKSHIPLYLCIPTMPNFETQSFAEAFLSGSASSLIIFPDFVSGGTLPTLFHSIQYIYPGTDFTLDSTSTSTFRGAIREFFSVLRVILELAQPPHLHLDPHLCLAWHRYIATTAPPQHAITPPAQSDGESSVAEDHPVRHLLPCLEPPHPTARCSELDHS